MESTHRPLQVLGISGSLRTGSYNRLLLRSALRSAADAGARVREADLKILDLPAYDEDLRTDGEPPSVTMFRRLVADADVIFIAMPEYNYSVPGTLKNAIDWASRKPNVFDGKTAAIFGASTGPYGTVRGQAHLRLILGAMNVYLVPQPQVLVRSAEHAFTPDGTLADERAAEQLRMLIQRTLQLARALDFTRSASESALMTSNTRRVV